jgi:hypothetical protein
MIRRRAQPYAAQATANILDFIGEPAVGGLLHRMKLAPF